MWAKLDQPDAVYYDITWTVSAETPRTRVREVFETVREARDQAIEHGRRRPWRRNARFADSKWTTPRADHIRDRGFGDRFVHRTGHSIGTEVHGTGANMDNLETHDERRILPGALFSVEPGIYLEDFGVRFRSQRLRHARIRLRRPVRCSGIWSGSDNLRGANENSVQHRLRQFAGGSVLLARMIRAQQMRNELVQHIMAEPEIRQPARSAPRLFRTVR